MYVTDAATARSSPVVPAAAALLKNPVRPIAGVTLSLSDGPISLLNVKSQSSDASEPSPSPRVR